MSKRFITHNEYEGIGITQIVGDDPDGFKLTKTLFALSRTTDLTIKFDPTVHTREAIAAGLEGHRPLAVLAEIEDTDLPSDHYFRNAWEWEQ